MLDFAKVIMSVTHLYECMFGKQGEGPTAPAAAMPAQQQQLPSSVAPAPHTQLTTNQNQQQGPTQGNPFPTQPPPLMMQQGMSITGAISTERLIHVNCFIMKTNS